MTFDAPLFLLLTLVAPVILWRAREAGVEVRRLPSVALVPSSPSGAAAVRRVPPLWAFAAAAACVFGAAAAARPRGSGAGLRVWLDASPAMARVDEQGLTRFARARAALQEALRAEPASRRVALTLSSGFTFAGSPAAVADVLARLEPTADLTRPRRDGAPPIATDELWVLTCDALPYGAARTWRFAAVDENVGLTATYAEEGRVKLVVVNGGPSARTVNLRSGAETVRADLGPREARVVAWPDAAPAGEFSVVPADGLPDALALDNAIAAPATGLDVRFDAGCPAPLRRALEAVAKSRGPLAPDSPRLDCVKHATAAPPGARLLVEYALSVGDGAAPRSSVPRWLPSAPLASLELPGTVPGSPWPMADAWIADARDGASLVGLDARGAHIGIDTRDDSLARSPVLPVLVAALVDELLRRAGIDAAREPFWTLDAGTDRDSEETGPRGAGDDIDRAVAFFGWAAAALAGLAGLLVFARR